MHEAWGQRGTGTPGVEEEDAAEEDMEEGWEEEHEEAEEGSEEEDRADA